MIFNGIDGLNGRKKLVLSRSPHTESIKIGICVEKIIREISCIDQPKRLFIAGRGVSAEEAIYTEEFLSLGIITFNQNDLTFAPSKGIKKPAQQRKAQEKYQSLLKSHKTYVLTRVDLKKLSGSSVTEIEKLKAEKRSLTKEVIAEIRSRFEAAGALNPTETRSCFSSDMFIERDGVTSFYEIRSSGDVDTDKDIMTVAKRVLRPLLCVDKPSSSFLGLVSCNR